MTIILLAGGKSSRMKQEKGLVLLNGKMMIEHILDKIKLLSQNILIIAHHPDYQQFNVPVVADLVADCGPMGGILTALHYTKTDKNLVLSCDIPFISSEILSTLMANAGDELVLAASHQGKIEPLCAVYDRRCLPFFSESIQQNQLKMMLLLEKLAAKTMDFSESESCFKNVNTPEDL
jgi:molybdenum cofactor guanylyltransferase